MTEVQLTSLLLQLADHGVTGVKIKYDGGGDSGAIEWIGFTTKPCETPEDVDDNMDDWADDARLSNLGSDVYTLVESFADGILGDIEDWWNNEGGFGDLCICVPSGKYIINNHVRIIETEDYFHDGSLLNKVKE